MKETLWQVKLTPRFVWKSLKLAQLSMQSSKVYTKTPREVKVFRSDSQKTLNSVCLPIVETYILLILWQSLVARIDVVDLVAGDVQLVVVELGVEEEVDSATISVLLNLFSQMPC